MCHDCPTKLIHIPHALSHWGVGRPQPQNPTLAWFCVSLPGTFPVSFAFWVRFGASSTDFCACRAPSTSWGHHKQKPCRDTSHHGQGALCSASFPRIALPGMPGQIPGGSKQLSLAVRDRAAPKWAASVYEQEQPPCHSHSWLRRPQLFDITHVFVILGGWLEGDGKGLGVNDLHQLYKQGKTAGLCFLLGALQASVLCKLPP